MKKEISDRYEPLAVEKKWIDYWEKNNSFQVDYSKTDPFSIVIPPPNVTGTLHIGHALNHTIQDIMIRIERKKGKATLWVPGMDHAGIATQVVVEKQLAANGQKRTDYTREVFINKVWDWKTKSGGQITHQQKMLGESVDWSKERFTFDEGLSKAVIKVFKTLFDEGLIYRGERIINWCPVTKTAISDIEVEFRETKGFLYHIRYPIKGTSDYIVVATTRPETMLGDVAVCAHPEDERYIAQKGAILILPLMNREIPLLFDSFVDKEFGSGLVKITPAHDANDYEAGKRLGLTPINIMNPDATLNENTGHYKGLDRYAARKQIIEDLQKLNLIEKIEDYTHSIGHNQRGGAVIEPYLSTQWFVKIKPLADKAIDAVRDGKIEIIPKMWEKTYFEWMEHIKDWCISRQLWWGHRIPAYYAPDGSMVVAESFDEAYSLLKVKNTKLKKEEILQDEDVLDTWFSSGLWPFSVLGWPEKTDDWKRFYPTSILVTGFDIIFFWVARMIMFGLKFNQGVIPFKKVLIHGLVRDKHGKKFSKSSGNTIDPLDMMSKYGTDSFRFFLAATLPEGKDILFDESRLDGYRSFCNKIWNSSRFILMNLPENFELKELNPSDLESSDAWILDRFNQCLSTYEKAYSEYRFYEMAAVIYDFIWGDICDWYIELVKPRIYGKSGDKSLETSRQTLVHVLLSALNLLHPFMPFITEEIYSVFFNKALTNSDWSRPFVIGDSTKVEKISLLIEIVSKVRVVRANLNIPPDKKCKMIIKSKDSLTEEIIKEEKLSILQLSRAEELVFVPNYATEQSDSIVAFSRGEIILPLSGTIDFGKERERLSKEKNSLETEMEKINKKLTNPEFISKAKPEVIAKEREKMNGLISKLDTVLKSMGKLN